MTHSIHAEAVSMLARSVASALAAVGSDPAGQPVDIAHQTQALRDLSIRARKLERAAKRPQALGFFGPSQAGKSFLVGALLSHELGNLEVLARGRTLDFLKEINPAKGVESTGVVTRFSTAQAPQLARGDFYCRLLSLETVLASLATGFLVECTAPPQDPERVERCLREARLAAGPPASATYRDAWELVWHELSKKYQDRHPYLNELRRSAVLGNMAFAADVKTVRGWLLVFSLLWGGTGHAPDIDKLAELLVLGLEALGHPEAIEAKEEHIKASSQGHSLIDAACLNSLGSTKQRVTVFVNGSAAEVALDPGVVSALIAEIHLPLRPSSGSLLERADILDFPGGRALKGINGFGKEELSTGRLDHAIEVYKRGKLTFLFEQYAVDREITALCLCSPGPTKPEAIQLQSQVESWLKIRYGAPVPKALAEVTKPSLFLALTKFDMSLGALRSDNAMGRWESRVQEACIDFWARSQASWVLNWGQRGRPFANSFWIRNPYADQMRSLAPGDPDYEAIKKGYFEARAVERHIERADEKWLAVEGEEAGLPKSGVPLLASSFRDKLAENVKAREMFDEASAIKSEVVSVLKALTPSGDENERRERLVADAKLLVDALQKEMDRRASGAPFGELMALVSLDEAATEAEVARVLGLVMPMGIKTADKVKRLVVHMVKWWREETTQRARSSELVLPLAALDHFVREICTSKKLLVALGTAVFPYLSRSNVVPSLLATIFRVKIADAMLTLFAASERKAPALPLRLSFAEPHESADAADKIDWSDVDFDAEEPSQAVGRADVVFAGSRFFTRWSEGLPAFYLENAGKGDEGAVKHASTAELARVLKEVEGIHVQS